mmetsp:Transcript_43938/g.171669  ORF Transcript_43938/g.171669 Transcript_43938/m.171669 type:complete len:110 (-) Transcript_43938:487-816(-)
MGFGEFDALSVQNVLLRASSSRWEEVGSWESWRFQGDVSVVLSAGMAFSSADLATSSAAAAPSARIGGRSTGRVGVLWTSLSTDMAKGSCCDRMFFKSGGQSIYDSESL